MLLAAGAAEKLECNAGNAFERLKHFWENEKDWIFGHLGYDLKNETGDFSSGNADGAGFPDLFFFRPGILLKLSGRALEIGIPEGDGGADDERRAARIYREILSSPAEPPAFKTPAISLQTRMGAREYLDAVKSLRHHIHAGDCYEVNFCREFFAEDADIEPLPLFHRFNAFSPAPFSAYYRTGDKYLLCSSPERFLQKQGSRIISQPIKGTAKREADPEADLRAKRLLSASRKERAENVMTVDLVRNDLSHTARKGTVKVEELCAIHSFAQVHHLVSTIVSELDPAYHFIDSLRFAFPMGSMTGAPKINVMQMIEDYEKTKRGLFSGALGYITPEGDFDFNVVIRSMLYNQSRRYLSFQAGSAITFYSDPEKELAEGLLKAAAMKKVIGANGTL